VGRADALSALDQMLSPSAGPNVALVLGEAGIGKTRLVEAFTTMADERSHRVIVGGCVKVSGEPIPYAPVAEALRHLSRIVSADESSDAAYVQSAMEQVIGFNVPVQRDRAQLFERILAALSVGLVPAARLILVFEDLHWSDQGTLDLVSFLVRNMSEDMAMVLTMRDDEIGERSPQRELVGRLSRSSRFLCLELDRFDLDELRRFAHELTDRDLHRPELSRLFARCQGNPFIAEELIRAGESGLVPPSLEDVLLARTRALSGPSEELVRIAATIGRPAEFELVVAACQMEYGTATAALREATDAGVLVRTANAGEYNFRHVLTREALLNRLLPHERRQLHSAVADVLGSRREVGHSAGRAAEWATHLYASGRQSDALAAAAFAGQKTASVHAYAEAWRQYQHALELLDVVDLPSDVRLQILSDAADAARWGGSLSDAVKLSRVASELATDSSDQAEAFERLGRFCFEAGDVDVALATIEEAATLASALPDSVVTAQVAASRARMYVQLERYEEAVVIAQDAVQLAERVGAPAHEGRARTAWGSSLVFLGDAQRGLALIEQGRDLIHRHGDLDEMRRADSNLLVGLVIAGRTAAACEVALTGLELLRRYGIETAGGGALTSNAVVLLRLAGRWSEAERISDEVLAGGLPEGQALRINLARSELELRRGRIDQARGHLDEAWRLGGDRQVSNIHADLLVAEAELALLKGAIAEAQAWLARAVRVAEQVSDPRLSVRCYTHVLWAEAEASERARVRRPASGQQAETYAAEVRAKLSSIRERSGAPEIDAYRLTGEAEFARGQGHAIPESWKAAAEAWTVLGRVGAQAYCTLRWAEAELAARHIATATPLLRRAHDLARALGAAPLLTQAEDLAQRRRISLHEERDPSSKTRTATGAVLTERELDVLRELVQGRTNRQIADALFLSHRTVGVHVSNLLAKLAVRTRGEAMAEVARLRLFDV
jgi:DNA-binding CsgD family transcriptional regulator/tetratricopeptide (TPR) repeat protein